MRDWSLDNSNSVKLRYVMNVLRRKNAFAIVDRRRFSRMTKGIFGRHVFYMAIIVPLVIRHGQLRIIDSLVARARLRLHFAKCICRARFDAAERIAQADELAAPLHSGV